MNDRAPGNALLHHGQLLLQQGRFAEAEGKFREALQQDPLNDFLLHHLAFCQYHQPGGEERALGTIGDAIARDPNAALHHALRAQILADLRRWPEAMEAAAQAVALAPDYADSHNAMTYVLLRREKWADAEASARRALALDADDEAAANHLAAALRLQNKLEENADQLRGMLARDPENSSTHASAGWSALQAGRREEAERHFLESLRLQPGNEAARSGLLESFKGRSPVYRAYLSYCFFMQRLSSGQRWIVIIGLYLAYRFSRAIFTGSLAPIGITLTVLYLSFALWSFLARGVGGVLLLMDRLARHVLSRAERLEALFVGGGVLAGVALLIGGLAGRWFPATIWGAACLTSTIPFSCTFRNESKVGRLLFGAIGVYTLVVGALLGAAMALQLPGGEGLVALATGALIAAIATTWLANVPALHR